MKFFICICLAIIAYSSHAQTLRLYSCSAKKVCAFDSVTHVYNKDCKTYKETNKFECDEKSMEITQTKSSGVMIVYSIQKINRIGSIITYTASYKEAPYIFTLEEVIKEIHEHSNGVLTVYNIAEMSRW